MTTELITTKPLALDVPEFANLPAAKSEQIRNTFLPMADAVERFEDAYNAVMAEAAEAVTPEVSAKARRLRLDIAKIRVAADKARVEIKAEYLLAGRAIDGANNVLKFATDAMEKALDKIEKHAARIEQERLEAIQIERVELLAPYVADADERDLSGMDDDVWAAYLATKRKDHEDRLEAEQAAEIARVAAAEANARFIARSALVAPVFDFFHTDADLGLLPELEFEELLKQAADAKEAYEAEQERVRLENARLAKEKAEAEKKRLDELAKIEAERKAEREKAEAEARTQRQAAEAERKRREELEEAERQRVAKEKAEAKTKAEAAAKAAKAPVKKRLNAWVDSFDLPALPGEEHAVATHIRDKFDAFHAWARKEVDAI